MEGFLLVTQIHGTAEVIARIVEAGGEQRGATAVVGDRGFTFPVNHVDASTKLVVVTEATSGIQGSANLGIGGVVHAHFRLRRGACMFRLKVDHPAHAGAGRAVHQGVGPFEDLNALHHLRVHHLTRQHPGESAEGHIIPVELQAANAVALRAVAVALHGLDARIVSHHVGYGARLLIFHQFGGVADDVERHVHGILLPEHPHASAVCHLAVQEGWHQLVAAGFKIAGSGLYHEGLFFFVLSRDGGMGDGTDGKGQQRFVHCSGVVHD